MASAAAATAGDARRMPLLLEPAARPVQVSEFTKTVNNSQNPSVRCKLATPSPTHLIDDVDSDNQTSNIRSYTPPTQDILGNIE